MNASELGTLLPQLMNASEFWAKTQGTLKLKDREVVSFLGMSPDQYMKDHPGYDWSDVYDDVVCESEAEDEQAINSQEGP